MAKKKTKLQKALNFNTGTKRKHTTKYLKGIRDTLLRNIRYQEKSALSEGKNKSKYKNEATKAFYESNRLGSFLDEAHRFQSFNDTELKRQINQMQAFMKEREDFIKEYESGNVDAFDDDTVISWKASDFEEDDKKHIYMKDVRAQWDEAGQEGDADSAPTWIKVMKNIFDTDEGGSVTIGAMKEKLNEKGVSNEDKELISTLLGQIQRKDYYRGRV